MRDKLQKAWVAAGTIGTGVDAMHKVLSNAGIRPDLSSFEQGLRQVWNAERINAAVVDYAMKFVPEPDAVTWTFEVATTVEMDGDGNVIYGGWQARTGTVNPTAAPEGMIRNVKGLTAQQSRDAECLDVLRAPATLKARAAAVIKILENDR